MATRNAVKYSDDPWFTESLQDFRERRARLFLGKPNAQLLQEERANWMRWARSILTNEEINNILKQVERKESCFGIFYVCFKLAERLGNPPTMNSNPLVYMQRGTRRKICVQTYLTGLLQEVRKN